MQNHPCAALKGRMCVRRDRAKNEAIQNNQPRHNPAGPPFELVTVYICHDCLSTVAQHI
jgi:hypothetical protein